MEVMEIFTPSFWVTRACSGEEGPYRSQRRVGKLVYQTKLVWPPPGPMVALSSAS